MARAKKEMDEAEIYRYAEIKKNEKKEAELDKKRMLEQLARDKEERFGKKFDAFTQQASDKVYTPYENATYYLKAIKTLYPSFRAGDTTKDCFNTIKVVLANIIKNSTEEKFRKVKTTNPNFHERVGKIELAIKVLHALGFKQEGEFLVCASPDLDTFGKVITYLEEEINKLD
jgi:hypothetical protein